MSSFVVKSLVVAVGIALSGAAAAADSRMRVLDVAPPSAATVIENAGDGRVLLLRAGIFDPLTRTVSAKHAVPGLKASSPQPRYAIVQFDKVDADSRRSLEALGAAVLGYVPNNAYYVRLNGLDLASLRGAANVRWAGAVQPELKIDPALYSTARGALAIDPANQRHTLEIETMRGESPAAVAKALQQAVTDIVVTHVDAGATGRHLRASVRGRDLDALLVAGSALESVQFIAPWTMPKLSNSGSIGAIQGDAVGVCAGEGNVCGPTPLWDHQLFGSGQIVAVADSGLDADEAWFTTLDKGAGPVTAITPGSSPALPNAGTTFPDYKVFAYWVQPGATAGDNNRRCTPTAAPTGFHGTHVNGTVAGDIAGTFGANVFVASTPLAANHERADGMAPNAQILFQDIGNDTSGCLSIEDFAGTLRQANAGGAHIHSNSWGSASYGVYGGNDQDVDQVTREDEDLMVVIAAGNDGEVDALAVALGNDPCPVANRQGDVCVTSTGTPANAKNALSVGALEHAGSTAIIGFSSRGPTADGRIKPDIMAPGTDIVSAAGDTTIGATVQAPVTSTKSGTSMATPTISGNAALLRQYFVEGFYPRGARAAADALNPSGMAMKAVLLNGTRPIDDWPAMNTGWGRAWLDGSLWFAQTQAGGNDARRMRLFERTNATGLATGESNSYTIANVQAGAELRATLTWYDVPGASMAAATLVNNLDLEVTGPGGTVWRGNVFANGVSTTGGNADLLNTVEQVRLTAPSAGRYTFRVTGAAVPGDGSDGADRQGYALVVSGGFGLPDQPAFAAPTSVAVARNDATGIGIGFASPAAPQGYQLYRANGTCATAAPGDFRLVATGDAAPLVDDRTQGGMRYAYKVRGIANDVEGAASACVDAVSADTCSLLPTRFAVTDIEGRRATCGVSLGWAASQSTCPASSAITYKVQRSTSPAFSAPQTVIENLGTPNWLDTGVANGQAYFYRVVAMDASGNTRTSAVSNITPSGAAGPDPASYRDDADTRSYARLEAPWILADTAANDGAYSYHTGPAGTSTQTCAALDTEKLTIAAGSTLEYYARYNLEHEWDGVVVQISTDDGATWADLPPDGGYPSSFAQTEGNGCNFPKTQGAFNGASTAASNAGPNTTPMANVVFKPFRHDLAAYAGRAVLVRWRVSSDTNTDFGGFWLDSIRIGVAGLMFRDGFEASDYRCR